METIPTACAHRIYRGSAVLIWILPLLLMGKVGMAQQTTQNEEALVREIQIQEVVVQKQVDMATRIQRDQRASLQMPTDKVMEHIPGIQMIKRGNYAWEPTIRSLNAGQINVTIDGMHIFGACTDRMDPVSSYIEPNNLKSISLNLSPDYGNYGGSIGGGIDFKLREAGFSETPTFRGTLASSFETNGAGVQTLGSLEYLGPRLAVQANALFRQTANYRAAKRQEVLFSQYSKWNAALSAAYRLTESHDLQLSYIQDEGRDIGYPALTMDVAFANAKIASLTHHYHSSPHHGELGHSPRGLVHWRNKIYTNFIDHAMDDTKRPAEQVPMHMDMPGQSRTSGFFSEARFLLPLDHILDLRLSGYQNQLSADMTMYPSAGTSMYMFTIPDAERNHLSLDLSDRISFGNRLHLSVNTTLTYSGSRLFSEAGRAQLSGMLNGEDPDRVDLLWNLNLRAGYRLSSDWNLSAYLGRTSRSASLQEYYAFYIFNRLDGYDYLGSHRLNQEKAFNSNLAINFQQGPLQAEANAFAYFFTDYIAGRILPEYSVMTIGANGVKQYQNIGNARLIGGELSIGIRIDENLRFRSSNTYTRGTDQDGYALPLISPFQTVNTLYWSLSGYHLDAEFQYDAPQQHVSLQAYGELPTPEVALLHIGGRKSFQIGHTLLTASIRIENVMDRQYYRHQDLMKIARPGRNVITGVTFAF